VANSRGKRREFGNALEASALVVGTMLIAGLIAISVPVLQGYGIRPRTVGGLVGVAFSPLLHANLAHLAANATPMFVLLVFLFWDRHYYPKRTLAVIWIASGLGTWLIGRGGAVHIGASSVVYGLVAYLVVSGLLMKSWRSALVAFGVFVLYGGIIYGIVPQRGAVSWEGHLCGVIAGIWAASENH
jgi:membrane associated rhomboid family serine protease